MRTKGHQKRLLYIIYQYISRSLFKADRLMFALHIVNKMYSQTINEKVRTTYILVICGYVQIVQVQSINVRYRKHCDNYLNFQTRLNLIQGYFLLFLQCRVMPAWNFQILKSQKTTLLFANYQVVRKPQFCPQKGLFELCMIVKKCNMRISQHSKEHRK